MSDLILTYPSEHMPPTRRLFKAPLKISYESDIISPNHVVEPADEPVCDDSVCVTYPPARSKVLLHSCCAPCSGAMILEMVEKNNLDVTVIFYNPNIHPKKEYEIRKEENKRFAIQLGIPFVDCDYDSESWFSRMNGLELDPERGLRCTACFDMRMEVTAAYAHINGFSYFTTTNATSRWKDVNQVNESGVRAAVCYPDLQFWLHNWQVRNQTIFFQFIICKNLPACSPH